MADEKVRDYEFLSSENQNERLDKFLSIRCSDVSRSRLQSLIKNGHVWVDGILVQKPSCEIKPSSRIKIIVPPAVETSLIPEKIPLEIIYEDSDVMVINKQAGMVVHPGAGHLTGTLVNAALAHAPDLEGINGELRPGIVHRLDKDTSGVILIAKNERSMQWLQNQFKSRLAKKTYIALVDGSPPAPQGIVDAPIGRDASHRQRMSVVQNHKGRPAQTRFLTIEQFRDHTLLSVQPLTGRTHQIRVHLKFLGCPVTGDSIYGSKKKSINMDRFFLHAQKIQITLPNQASSTEFIARMPPDLEAILSCLRQNERML